MSDIKERLDKEHADLLADARCLTRLSYVIVVLSIVAACCATWQLVQHYSAR